MPDAAGTSPPATPPARTPRPAPGPASVPRQPAADPREHRAAGGGARRPRWRSDRARRGSRPDFLTEFVLYALSAADLAMILALVFVLARNILKMMVERRRGLPFAQFRSKLVGVLLGMTLIPSVLVLFVGSELIRTNLDRWFNAPMEEIVASANRIAGDYYRERQKLVDRHRRSAWRPRWRRCRSPTRTSRRCSTSSSPRSPRRGPAWSRSTAWRSGAGRGPRCRRSSTCACRRCRPDYNRASADRLAERIASGGAETHGPSRSAAAANCCGPRRRSAAATARLAGVVVASDYLTGEHGRAVAADDRRLRAATAS